MQFIIKYGLNNQNADITNIVLEKCKHNNILFIPSEDCNRCRLFGDPVYGTVKSIFIYNMNDNSQREYDSTYEIYIDLNTNTLYSDFLPDYIQSLFPKNTIEERKNLQPIQSQLTLYYGKFNEEYPEQRMAVKYITGHEKILEIGSNIGRNTLIMGYLLKQQNSNALVSLECDSTIFNQLKQNRDANNMNFYIENAALSKRKLIQKGWNTIVSDILLDGYTSVNTITMEELNRKYSIPFDTLILDCEGAFYYILLDMPEILDNIRLIIMENDYSDLSHKQYIDDVLKKHNFKRDYVESGGYGVCMDFFYEVWTRG